MELKNNKRMHLRCPKRGHDFAIHTNEIEERYSVLKIKVENAKRQLEQANKSGMNHSSPEYKRIKNKYQNTVYEIQKIKAVRRALSDESERQKYIVFKKLVAQIIGQEKVIELMTEAEESLVYNNYDTAIQNHNRFNGV